MRRSLTTTFDNAAARHAATPAPPSQTAQSAGGSAAAIFVATIKYALIRQRFDESVSKHVEAFTAEDVAFTTLFTLDDAAVTVRVDANRLLYSTLELLVQHLNSPATDWLDNSGQSHPHGGTGVLFEFVRRLLHADAPFQATSDLLGVRVFPTRTRTQVAIADFNDALTSARRR
ncbi:hypothetical protein CYMTET_53514 [Cymbomonas tetramitiformis]|uniref:Uncharacterized protein n=1 Tax=Cymbomonas tetramitiformis TaxID=36881 RepID=A0AAE0BH25_9CHLO|nr:hypothetical protein CYMTET_53514 [Cymbomonas tetramitiformis]